MDRLIIEDQRDAEVLRWVQLAVCADPERPRIAGMFVHNDDETPVVAGADGFRIHTWYGDVPEPLAEVESNTILRVANGQDLAKAGWRVYPCEELEGTYPAIDEVKPSGRLRAVIKLNPRFLRDALEIPQRGEYQSYVTLRIYGNESDPVIIQSHVERRVIAQATVMQMHAGLADMEDKRLVEEMEAARRAQAEMDWIREHYPDVAMEAEEKAGKEESK